MKRPDPASRATQRRTACAHVHTHSVAMSHGVCARVHRPRCNVTPRVRTCTPTALQRYTACAHVYTDRVTTSHRVCARVQRPCCNVTPPVRTCTPTVLQRHTACAHVYTGRVATSHVACARPHPTPFVADSGAGVTRAFSLSCVMSMDARRKAAEFVTLGSALMDRPTRRSRKVRRSFSDLW
jgi:hypothetical protein